MNVHNHPTNGAGRKFLTFVDQTIQLTFNLTSATAKAPTEDRELFYRRIKLALLKYAIFC